MESSQPGTLEERLGKSSQQTGGGEGGGSSKNQFENWNMPRPGMSRHDDEQSPG